MLQGLTGETSMDRDKGLQTIKIIYENLQKQACIINKRE